ncbi:PLP-dependent aminotransferase family protein [Rheinheimera sp.]|uniref:aminotransferase-like domain-containing protein n=1 Tax=Rheinheimera sp. TaxID=1869214 RepID=UPI00307E60D8
MTISLLQWQLDKSARQSFVEQLFVQAKTAIETGRWAAGEKLPPIRSLAAELAVSKFTVSDLYDRLGAAGLVQAQAGSGVYVRAPRVITHVLEAEYQHSEHASDVQLMRQTLQRESDWLKVSAGWLGPDWLPDLLIRQGLRELARQGQTLTDYGAAQGYFPLRQQLTDRLKTLGLELTPAQLLLTQSASHALDLILRQYLRPGDAVVVDDPGFYNFFALLKLHQALVLPVPRQQDGPDLAVLEQQLQQFKPRLYLTNSMLSNPSGASVKSHRAYQVLQLLKQHQVLLVEDDIYADFESSPAPRYASLTGLVDSVYLGSLSKTLSADLRVGFIAGAPDVIASLTDLKLITGMSTSSSSERLMYLALTGGGYKRHLEQLRRGLAEARAKVQHHLQALGCSLPLKPEGGFLIWVRLPDGISSAVLSERLSAHQVLLAPGRQFSSQPDADQFTRLNVTQCLNREFWLLLGKELQSLALDQPPMQQSRL